MSTNIQFSLTAVEAKELLAGDSNGKSDPYFKIPHNQYGVLDLPGKKNRSKVVKKTLNPVWNHTYEKIEFNPTMCNKLDIEVFDYDTFGKDDPIGKASINLDWMKTEGQNTFDQWIPLTVTVKDKKTKTTQTMQKGSVHVRIKVLYRPQQGQPIPGQPPMGQPLPGQPPMGQPLPGQPPMGQPLPGQPPMGQPFSNGTSFAWPTSSSTSTRKTSNGTTFTRPSSSSTSTRKTSNGTTLTRSSSNPTSTWPTSSSTSSISTSSSASSRSKARSTLTWTASIESISSTST